ncbi:hypothetical protein TNCV_675111 [Trichonephila clavipes]|nr:hypothetical protein TNCV_675111 [Trichonephila clavipes]
MRRVPDDRNIDIIQLVTPFFHLSSLHSKSPTQYDAQKGKNETWRQKAIFVERQNPQNDDDDSITKTEGP